LHSFLFPIIFTIVSFNLQFSIAFIFLPRAINAIFLFLPEIIFNLISPIFAILLLVSFIIKEFVYYFLHMQHSYLALLLLFLFSVYLTFLSSFRFFSIFKLAYPIISMIIIFWFIRMFTNNYSNLSI